MSLVFLPAPFLKDAPGWKKFYCCKKILTVSYCSNRFTSRVAVNLEYEEFSSIYYKGNQIVDPPFILGYLLFRVLTPVSESWAS
jgi:hypothetical protein